MMRLPITVCLTVLLLFSAQLAAQTPSSLGKIERLDPALDALLADDAKIEVLAGGFTWTEGPVWVADDDGGHLLFSDIPRNSIFRWDPRQKEISLFMHPSGYTGVDYYGLEPGSNGLALDAEGRLLACEHGDRRVSVLTEGGGKRTLVDAYQGKRLNSPNDLVVHSSGAIFFTDPPYGLPRRGEDERRELSFCGVYRLDEDGELTRLTKELDRPNGIALSPDEKTLYLAQSDPKNAIWMAYPVNEDLTIGEGRLLHDATDQVGKLPGLPDGLTVDPKGNLWASGPGGIYIFTAEGKLIGRLLTGQRTSNCTLGGPGGDMQYLYLTADSYLCRVKLK